MTQKVSLRATVRSVVEAIERGGPSDAKREVERVRPLVPKGRPHLGKENMTPDEVIEWYAGELLEIVDNEKWFAMNSILNCLDKFVPAG